VSVHFYPKSGEILQALGALSEFQIGKPLVLEEIFPLSCSAVELSSFMIGSKKFATGWLTFYWGETIAEYHAKQTSAIDAVTAKWLEIFSAQRPAFQQ